MEEPELFPSLATPSFPQAPLARRLRPRTWDEVVGQDHLLGPGRPLRELWEKGAYQALVFFGPPGCGKTTFAELFATTSTGPVVRLDGAKVIASELRRAVGLAHRQCGLAQSPPLLVIDEIHRLHRDQQEILLAELERGIIRLVGATPVNPCFFLTPPLISRCQIFELEALSLEALGKILDRALADQERGVGKLGLCLDTEARKILLVACEGDARKLLNWVEILSRWVSERPGRLPKEIGREELEAIGVKKWVRYTRDGDEHYDTLSSWIKSIRGGDPDAAIYWLARMLKGGEDPRLLARRLVIAASEDVGLADPLALPLAVSAFHAIEAVGMPEASLALAEATLYLATAPKSNAAYRAIQGALDAWETKPSQEVPSWLRDAHFSGAKTLGRGTGYLYSHEFPEGVAPQSYGVTPGSFYQPTDRGYEKLIRERLDRWRELRGGAADPS